MMDVDRLLAERLQAREQEELTDEKKARLFIELLDKRKKHFAALRAQEKRNKPPTKAQNKSTMSTYLKHMDSYKQSQLKNKSFIEIQKLFDKAMTRVNMFIDMDTELVEGSEKRAEDSTKRAGTELEQEVAKKQKINDDQEEAEMKKLIEVVPDKKEVAIDAIPLATKPPSIIDWKIIKEGKLGYYQIIRADGSSKRYSSMIQMLRDFNREDLETLWKLVKAKHGSTRPEEGYERGRIVGIKRLHDVLEVTTAQHLFVNGSLHGYFKGKRGLRQGDLMSPYLFTLVMEVLTLMLHRRVSVSNSFTYHRYCSNLNIINLCFADDLFLFAHGDVNSARVIMESLDEFKCVSGLNPSLPKSMAYFCNVLNHTKIEILNILPFEEGKLPVKYLGVPLVPSRLVYRDCAELMERIKARVRDWKNKFLSFAGRTQLIRSVLSSMHVYWASVFILPVNLMHELEQVMRGFLWCQGEMKRGKAKVAWDVVCLPMKEGGLGIRRLEMFNVALISSHIWSIITDKESLWVKWIHSYKLKRRSLWDIPFRGNMSWGWRKILKIRNLVKPFIWSRIGNGQRTSAWYDNWSPLGQLSNVISNRDIYSAGFKLDMRVSDIIKDGMWAWPTDWLIKYPMISNINAPVLTGSDDYIVLRNHSNMDVRFSVATIWDCIRPRNAEVNWFHIVWFSQKVPRHAIHLWKEIKEDGECSKDPSDLEVARVVYLIVFSVLMVRLHRHVLSKFSVEVKLELEVNVVALDTFAFDYL
ncbi:putative RNA-directed DNA polymerase [Tanacetum coccineum]